MANAIPLPPYTGWRPRSMREGRRSSERGGMQRDTKRSRLGNEYDRALYCASKSYRNSTARYQELCAVADGLNGISRKPAAAAAGMT